MFDKVYAAIIADRLGGQFVGRWRRSERLFFATRKRYHREKGSEQNREPNHSSLREKASAASAKGTITQNARAISSTPVLRLIVSASPAMPENTLTLAELARLNMR